MVRRRLARQRQRGGDRADAAVVRRATTSGPMRVTSSSIRRARRSPAGAAGPCSRRPPASGGRTCRCRRIRRASRPTTPASCSARTSSPAHALMQYVNQNPTKRFRERHGLDRRVARTATSTATRSSAASSSTPSGRSQNYWDYRAALFVTPGAFSDRLTRGGPLVRTPARLELRAQHRQRRPEEVLLRRRRAISTTATTIVRARRSASSLNVAAVARTCCSASSRPSGARTTSRSTSTASTTPSATATFGRRYVFAELEQRSFELGTRVDWTLSSRLSFQLYLQPFIASGDYHDYHALAARRARATTRRTPAVASDPDFNFRSVRGSAVVRWEFRPGSALYVVWNENRADVEPRRRLPHQPRPARHPDRAVARCVPGEGFVLAADVDFTHAVPIAAAGFWVAVLLVAALVPCLPVAICVIHTSDVVAVDFPAGVFRYVAVVRDDQPLSLLAVVLFRGPPSLGFLV